MKDIVSAGITFYPGGDARFWWNDDADYVARSNSIIELWREEGEDFEDFKRRALEWADRHEAR